MTEREIERTVRTGLRREEAKDLTQRSRVPAAPVALTSLTAHFLLSSLLQTNLTANNWLALGGRGVLGCAVNSDEAVLPSVDGDGAAPSLDRRWTLSTPAPQRCHIAVQAAHPQLSGVRFLIARAAVHFLARGRSGQSVWQPKPGHKVGRGFPLASTCSVHVPTAAVSSTVVDFAGTLWRTKLCTTG